MEYKAERVCKEKDYELRNSKCGCKTCRGFLNPSLVQQERTQRKNQSYMQKYAGPIIFAAIILGLAAVSSYFFDNNASSNRSSKSGIEEKINLP